MHPLIRTTLLRHLTSVIVLAVGAHSLEAQGSMSIHPTVPAPGSLVRLILRDTASPDSIVDIRGVMAEEPLHFRRLSTMAWEAIGPIPVDASGTVVAHAFIERHSGSADTVTATVTMPKPRPSRGRPRKLAVSSRFTRPLDAETQARIADENARARELGRKGHSTPRLWTTPFLLPRASAITSRFGSGRMFNGTVASRHLGVDFSGARGSAVRAANRGVVALVDDFFLAGNVVYIDHGEGVVTGYFHLSETLVSAGDTVSRGQDIGRVGASGRVTGPHLHWSARYGSLTVNPLDLVRVSGGR